MIGIVVSEADHASEHLGEHLLDLRAWDEREDDTRPPAAGGGTVHRSGPFELRTFADLHLHLDDVAAAFDDPDLVVFASRHSGDTGPLLTAHFTGNVGPAEYGGDDHALATAAPAALDRVVDAFESHAPDDYEVGIEATHHGPSEVGAPSLFVELGSDEAEWRDPEGARAVARAILALGGDDTAGDDDRAPVEVGGGRTVVGFGGGHYAPRFERVRRETGWQVGHVLADWGLAELGHPDEHRDLLTQAFEASGATLALVDGDRPQLVETVEDLGYRVVSETWLRETDGVAPAVVERVERDLGTVADGVRFGASAAAVGPDAAGDLSVVALPDDLLAAALGVEADAAREAAAETLVAHETEEAGTRPQGRAVVRSPADRERLVDRLVDVLDAKYDAVERRDGAVAATETAFDPERARERGVDPGPAFGRLADGESVEVDGEVVDPADVTVERVDRFEVP